MNLGALRAATLRRLRADYQADALTELVNIALHTVETERDWPWYHASATVATVKDTATYALPSDWKRTARLYLPDTPVLEYAPPDVFRSRFYGNPAPSGKPDAWTWWANQLVIGPTPDGVYSITHEYLKAESDLAVDTDTPLMPARFHGAIIEQALILSLDVLGAEVPESRLVRASKAYADWLRKMGRDSRVHRGGVAIRVTGA